MPLVINNETYYTAAEAARYLNISRDTFYENVKRKVQSYKHGIRKRLYYRQSDLDELQNIQPVDRDKKNDDH